LVERREEKNLKDDEGRKEGKRGKGRISVSSVLTRTLSHHLQTTVCHVSLYIYMLPLYSFTI